MPEEYLDFLLLKDLYHCTPNELDEQPDYIVEMHKSFLRIDAIQENIDRKRAEQAARHKQK